MKTIFVVLFIFITSSIFVQDSISYQRNERFKDTADSLDWWRNRRFHLDGMKPFTKEELGAMNRWKFFKKESGDSVLIFENVASNDTFTRTHGWRGTIVKNVFDVFFLIKDSLGNESEHHILDIEFLDSMKSHIKFVK